MVRCGATERIQTDSIPALAELMGRWRREMGDKITHEGVITVCEGTPS